MFQVLRCAVSDVARDIMEFVLSLFRCLKMQMGVEFAGQIIDLFLDLFTRSVVLFYVNYKHFVRCCWFLCLRVHE